MMSATFVGIRGSMCPFNSFRPHPINPMVMIETSSAPPSLQVPLKWLLLRYGIVTYNFLGSRRVMGVSDRADDVDPRRRATDRCCWLWFWSWPNVCIGVTDGCVFTYVSFLVNESKYPKAPARSRPALEISTIHSIRYPLPSKH